jgi:hypothetical protein
MRFRKFSLAILSIAIIYLNSSCQSSALIHEFEDEVSLAKHIRSEMNELGISGTWLELIDDSIATKHTDLFQSLNRLKRNEFVAGFELNQRGDFAYHSRLCKDPKCGDLPTANLTMHVIGNSVSFNQKYSDGGELIESKIIDNWFYHVYQQIYP